MERFYALECKLFRKINRYFERRLLNRFFRTVTHIGGATFTISLVLGIILLSSESVQYTAIASAIALTISHIPVALIKKMYPRSRPYIVLEHIHVTDNPLKDHSFPSGHTTAIFAILTPFVLLNPVLSLILVPVGLIVGFSRIYLGLHYPSDVLAGCLLGCVSGFLSFMWVKHFFLYGFM
ncbi:MAG TPA: phosphatase PAP2 family protein [Bacillus sp. (in: firmicutes)]|nr:phosphatase PAP2 family protein [Bacillus sp. (in: firmicutes)]